MKKFLNRKATIIIYLFITLVMFAFINTSDATSFAEPIVFYINRPIILIHLLFSLIVLAIFLISFGNTPKIDFISIMLLLKMIIDLISFLINNNTSFEYFFTWYACSIISFISYFLVSQFVYDNGIISCIVICFSVIIALQVIYTFIFSDCSFTDINYKHYMVIPYGGTNIISSILVPTFYFGFKIKNKILNMIYKILLLIAIVLTKSRGGIILITISLFAYYIFENDKKDLITKIIVIGIFTIILINIFNIPSIKDFFKGYSDDYSSANELSSGRLKLFQIYMNDFFEKPIIGHSLGVSPRLVKVYGAHNLFIDLLFKCGILGFITYFMILIYIIINIKFFKKTSKVELWVVFVFFINTMFEVCYFSYECDAMFWLFIGMLVSNNKVKIMKNN